GRDVVARVDADPVDGAGGATVGRRGRGRASPLSGHPRIELHKPRPTTRAGGRLRNHDAVPEIECFGRSSRARGEEVPGGVEVEVAGGNVERVRSVEMAEEVGAVRRKLDNHRLSSRAQRTSTEVHRAVKGAAKGDLAAGIGGDSRGVEAAPRRRAPV